MAASTMQSTAGRSAVPQMPDGRTVEQAADDYTRMEYRRGYPFASEEEIQMLLDAEKKAGYPADDLQQAKEILGKS